MRRRRVVAGLLLAIVLSLAALLAWCPARWAWSALAPRWPQLQLSDVHGTVWSGGAGDVVYDGQALGQLHWRIGRAALIGRLHGAWTLSAQPWSLRGQWARRTEDTWAFTRIHGWIDASLLPASALRGLHAGGRVQIDVPALRLQRGWPVHVRAVVRWVPATLDAGGGPVSLGEQQMVLQDRSGTSLVGRIGSVGDTALRSRGMLQVSALAWRLQLELRPADADHPALRRVLARLGQPGPDGSLQLSWHGGLLSGD